MRLAARCGRVVAEAMVALAALAIAAHPAGGETRGPKPVASAADVPDGEVEQAVKEELERDRHHVSVDLGVTAKARIVELTGVLPLRSWRDRAERVARNVRGVRAVVNRIRVVAKRRRDDDILRDVYRGLRRSAALVAMPIKVAVRKGVVALSGFISTWEEQQLAERVAYGVPGVRFCENQLALSRHIVRGNAILTGDIQSRLDWDPLVEHDPIRVLERGTRVWLSGNVGSEAELRRAVGLAWVKDVSAVDASGLAIATAPRPDANVRTRGLTDEQIRAAVEELRPYWPQLVNATFSVGVVGGIVTLRGTVPTLGDSHAAEEMARSAVSVVTIKNELRGPWWRPPSPNFTPPSRRRPRR